MVAATREKLGATDDLTGIHTGPSTLGGRYMRMFWHPIARSEDLPAGRARPIRIMGEDFTLYRGETRPPSGDAETHGPPPPSPHLLAFRCEHRGTQLSTGWVEGDDVRCFYHGWKYDASGQCIEQPAEPEPFCQRIRIKSYPLREYLGLVFAYLGEGEPPLFRRYPHMELEGVHETDAGMWPTNHFNVYDNDGAHLYFVHRAPGNDWREWNGEIPTTRVEESSFGVIEYEGRPGGKMFHLHRGMPNMIYFAAAHYPVGVDIQAAAGGPVKGSRVIWRVPIDDERHWRFSASVVHVAGEAAERYRERRRPLGDAPEQLAADVLAGKLTIDDVKEQLDPLALVNLQDMVSQWGQGAVVDRSIEHLGYVDTRGILFRKLWERELRLVAAGRAIKQWTLPEGLDRVE